MSFTALQSRVGPCVHVGLSRPKPASRKFIVRAAAEAAPIAETDPEKLGFKTMRKGIKQGSEETILTPRFYTTDFDEMERLFSVEINPNLDAEEIASSLNEFRQDYNQTHFVRNESFKKAAENITGPARKIFIEFLERSCTAEFSGFLLYKELARRLKKHNPDVAEIFNLLSRDEARHAGFLNKAMADFGLQLDLGFLTKNRSYTFFKPQFIILATFLSEKIGYWRYITIYRHLQRNPDKQIYPLFEYFENWCQDENRHGDFLAAVLKAKPGMLTGWQNALWSRFFCLSVYITMYLNDNQRTAFYELLGMDTREFDQHVIIETNKTAERCFLEVPDVDNPQFWEKMDNLIVLNNKLSALAASDTPDFVKSIQKLALQERFAKTLLQIFFSPTIKVGSFDMAPPEVQPTLQY